MSQFPPPSTPAELSEALTALDPAVQAAAGDPLEAARAAETRLGDLKHADPVTVPAEAHAATARPAPVLDDGPGHDALSAAELALSGPPSPHLAAVLAEVRGGAYAEQVDELVGAMFQVRRGRSSTSTRRPGNSSTGPSPRRSRPPRLGRATSRPRWTYSKPGSCAPAARGRPRQRRIAPPRRGGSHRT